jgi:hypothetical protein
MLLFPSKKNLSNQVDTSLLFAKLIITKNLGQNSYAHLEGPLYMIIPSRKEEGYYAHSLKSDHSLKSEINILIYICMFTSKVKP